MRGAQVDPMSIAAQVVDADVAAAEIVEPSLGRPELLPAEEASLGPVAELRRADFARGRTCARLAMAQIDPALANTPILRGEKREPLWPTGIVGAITHCRGYAAAVAAPADRIASVGLDAEPAEPLPDRVGDRIMTADEREAARACEATVGGGWERLVFCAKEAVYKAWFPMTGRWLGFRDAVVMVDAAAQTFTARLLLEGLHVGGRPVDTLHGRFAAGRGVIIAGVTLRAASETGPRGAPAR